MEGGRGVGEGGRGRGNRRGRKVKWIRGGGGGGKLKDQMRGATQGDSRL